jgi:hypothetical protein
MRVLIFSTTFVETLLFLRRIQRDMIKNVQRPSCTVPVILVSLSRNLNFLDRFSNTRIWNFMKIRPVAAELFHAGERTVTTKLIVAFRNAANAPHNNKRGNVFFHRIKLIRATLNKPINIIWLPCNWQLQLQLMALVYKRYYNIF